MSPLELVGLPQLMSRGEGRPEIRVSLIDGPVVLDHPDLAGATIREIPGKLNATCRQADSVACTHGTFVAGVLSARRGSQAPAICPGCTLLVRPIFGEGIGVNGQLPAATPEDLAQAVVESLDAGAQVLNISAAVLHPSQQGERALQQALDYAAARGAVVVAAAGNQGTVGSSVITRHPSVIPVAACNLRGRPTNESNLGNSIGRRGLSAPGENVTSLGTNGKPQTSGGTSAAAPFVSGAIALLWSEFPKAGASRIKMALAQASRPLRRSIVPPVLDAWSACQLLGGRQH